MTFLRRFQTIILILGDLILFYFSLYLTLALRYETLYAEELWLLHQLPFFYIHLVWLFIFYIGGLYDIKNFSSYKKLAECILKIMLAAIIMAVLILYLMPQPTVTPKTNLLIDTIFLIIFLVFWRKIFWHLARKTAKINVLFFGNLPELKDLSNTFKVNPYLGYEPVMVLSSVDHNLSEIIQKNSVHLIVAAKSILANEKAAKQFYEVLPSGVSIIDFETFYESLVEKIPIYLITETWFLENLREINKKLFEKFKRICDIAGAIVLGIPTILLLPFIALLIKIESAGPVFYKQKRVGKNEKIFEITKFRTMVRDAEKDGAKWAAEKDSRITKVGKFLRKTRLDELPQLINILKGEMSFIGPRPERPEFVEELKKEIPHYSMRHLIKPGLSGWAQIKFAYAASVEDAMEKLQYDLYYIKNRSVVLDLAIAAKTVALLMSRKGR